MQRNCQLILLILNNEGTVTVNQQ